MARSWLLGGPRRATEANDLNLQAEIVSGAYGGGTPDPVDGDRFYRAAGVGSNQGRPVPPSTVEHARAGSISAYRTNPMGRAIIDTYVAFCVGDVGVHPESQIPAVQAVLDEFWNDPLVDLGSRQELWLRSHLLYGETLVEAIVSAIFAQVRLRPIDVTSVQGVELRDMNPMWPARVLMATAAGPVTPVDVIGYDDVAGMRLGTAFWRADWQSVVSDTRGLPFLTPALDWLAAYDRTLWNLVDRTALARYMVWDVTIDGDSRDIEQFTSERGGLDPPESGSVEVHNEGVKWEPKSAPSMSDEDSTTAGTILTSVAGGVGLAKPWLSEAEGSNRASSVTMAEPVRRRVASVQRMWLSFMREICRFVVDQAVATGQLPRYSSIPDDVGGRRNVPTWRTVEVVGPEIASSDAAVNATILANVGAALMSMVPNGMLAPEAARRIARKAWEDYMGQAWRPGLDDEASTAEWLDKWGAKPAAAAPTAPGAAPGVDNTIGTGQTQPPRPPGDNTARVGAPL